MHMKKILLMLIITISILLAGCQQNNSEEVVCNDPYIRVGSSCCLDENSNSICDNDENDLKNVTISSENETTLNKEEEENEVLSYDEESLELVKRETGTFAFLSDYVEVQKGSQETYMYMKIRNPSSEEFSFKGGDLVETTNGIKASFTAGGTLGGTLNTPPSIIVPAITLESGEVGAYPLRVVAGEGVLPGKYYVRVTLEIGSQTISKIVTVQIVETNTDEQQEDIPPRFGVLGAYAFDSSDGRIDPGDIITIEFQLATDSEPIKFEDVTFALETLNGTYPYTYTTGDASSNEFSGLTLDYNHQEDNGYVNSEGVVQFTLASPTTVLEQEEFEIVFFPESTRPQRISLKTPVSMNSSYNLLR